MSTSQLNSVGTEISTGIYLTLWISLCFIDPSLLGFVAEIMYIRVYICIDICIHCLHICIYKSVYLPICTDTDFVPSSPTWPRHLHPAASAQPPLLPQQPTHRGR